MAIPASAVWEVRASGPPAADAGGGGWAPVTVSTFSGTDLVVDASLNTKVTSASHNFVAADVGGRIFISVATAGGWVGGFYTINSVASNAATLASSPAPISTTGGTWALVGQDRSQQNTVQVAIDNSTITTSIAANVITFTGYVPTVADVGNGVHMLTGTNVTAGWYFITAFTGSTWTVAGTAALPTSGTTTNATGNMGGALLTLGGLSGALIASNKAYGTGAFSGGTTTFAQTVTPSGSIPASRLVGYGAARGDAIHATFTLTGGAGQTALSFTGQGWQLDQFDVDCASIATSTGISVTSLSAVRNCKVSGATTRGIALVGANGATAQECEVTAGSAVSGAIGGTALAHVRRCFVHDNTGPGVVLTLGSTVTDCLISNNTGASSDGVQAAGSGVLVENCTIHGNGRDGIRNTGTNYVNMVWRNNILSNNSGFGITVNGTTAAPAMPDDDGNAYFSNTQGTRSFGDSVVGLFGVVPYVNSRDVILSVSPYVGGTTGSTANFALNNTAGGGASCRAAGTPSTFPGNTGTTSYVDMGAVQTRGSNTSPLAGGAAVVFAG